MELETALKLGKGDIVRPVGVSLLFPKLSNDRTYRVCGNSKPIYFGRGMDLFSEVPLRSDDLPLQAKVPIVDDTGNEVYCYFNYLELVRRTGDRK